MNYWSVPVLIKAVRFYSFISDMNLIAAALGSRLLGVLSEWLKNYSNQGYILRKNSPSTISFKKSYYVASKDEPSKDTACVKLKDIM
jgi:hypothetical protein